MPISTPHRYREGWVVFQRKTKSCPQTLEVPKSEILTPGQCKGELLQVRSSTQQVPKVCAAFITTGPNDLFPSPPLPPHALHPPGNFRTILHILLPLKPYPRPYLTLPLFSPPSRTFTQKPLQRDSSTQGKLVSSCIFRASFPFFSASHLGFSCRIYVLHGFGATCPALQAGRNILRTQELPENQRPPAPSRRLLGMAF